MGGGVRPSWAPGPGRLFAIWPARVNADACFEKAGFHEWSDGVEGAEDEFPRLVTRLVGCLERVGFAVLREGEYPKRHRGLSAALSDLFKQNKSVSPGPTIVDALLAAAWSDNFLPCVVNFGEPPQAALRTGDGHDLLWMWTSDSGPDVDGLLDAIAEGRPLRRLTLDWTALASERKG